MAIGSGSEGANTALQEEFKPELSLEEAEVLVLKTLKQVMEEKVLPSRFLAGLRVCKQQRAAVARQGCQLSVTREGAALRLCVSYICSANRAAETCVPACRSSAQTWTSLWWRPRTSCTAQSRCKGS